MVADSNIDLTSIENENVDPKIEKPLSAVQKRILELKKPLNLTTTAVPEIELDLVPKNHQKVDEATKWLMERTGFKKQQIPTKSPQISTSPKNKYQKKKLELQKQLAKNTREEQAKRYEIFNADNENFGKTDEEEFDFYESEDEEELLLKTNKEDENGTSEEELEEEEDDEEENDDEEAIEDAKNEFIDDAALENDEEFDSDAFSRLPVDDSDVDDDQINVVSPQQNLNISDVDVHNDDENNETTQNLMVNVPNCPSQMIEPPQFTNESIEPAELQQNSIFDTATTMNELMDLCSGGFSDSVSSSNGTNSSGLNIMDYLPDKTPVSTPVPAASTSVRLSHSCDDTSHEIEDFLELFEKADDTVLNVDWDSDSDEIVKPPARKRKIVAYSDDEEEEKKMPRLFDSDDESVSDSLDFIDEELDAPEKIKKKPLIDLGSDFVTTEDPSNLPAATTNMEYSDSKRWITEIDDENYEKNDIEDNAKFFDDEAELSGDDVGSSDDEADEEGNEYERQECDDEVYDQEELRNNLAQQVNKQVQDEEYRRLRYLQEKLIGDDLQSDNADRSFRYRLKKEISEDDWQKLVKMNPILATMDWDEVEEQDDEIQRKSIEVNKWKHSQTVCDNADDDLNIMADFGDSPLLTVGRQVMTKTTVQTRTAMISRDSLLGKNNFNLILKETQNVEMKSHTLFTSMKKPHLKD